MATPGGLDHHYGVVAATPVLLAGATALAVALIGRSRAARVLAAVGLVPAFALQVLLLAPEGIAWRCRGLHVLGAVYVHPVTIGMGLLLALVVAARRDPWRDASRHPALWCLQVAVALALPTVLLPALVLAVEGDHPQPIDYRPLRIGLAVVLSVAWAWWPLPVAAAMLLLLAVSVRSTWRWAASAAAFALAAAHLV